LAQRKSWNSLLQGYDLNLPSSFVRCHEDDPVVVAVQDVPAGAPIIDNIFALEPIPRGHKVAVSAIRGGEYVTKFGQPIGRATEDIKPGRHVHTHNLAFEPVKGDYSRNEIIEIVEETAVPVTFDGIIRASGRVATRNYVGILCSVNCSGHVAKAIAEHFRGADAMTPWPKVDGVAAFSHNTGCGISADGASAEMLHRTIAGYARHANFAAVLLVGLGCEANQITGLLEAEDLAEGPDLKTLIIQEAGGTRKAIQAGIKIIREMLDQANCVERVAVPAHHLVLGLQCGGSDGFSAITANPALGVASDLIIRQGGTAVLSETPELYGAEHLLLRRAASQAVADKLLARIDWWESYAKAHMESLNNNPSHGNKAGGVTTILEKSLGAVSKSGGSQLRDVYLYAERIESKGLVLMDSPGFDPVSATGQIASGCNMICFTTGRGSCYGAKPVPCLKLTTNTLLFERMSDDMDMNGGSVLDGDRSLDEMGQLIFSQIIKTASGHKTKSELLGYGEDEFVPWQPGGTY
jgi:altronate hydrolase